MLRRFLFFFSVSLLLQCSFAKGERLNAKAIVIRLEGVINPVLLNYVRDGIQKAKDTKAQVIFIELDTPGGLLDTTRSIITELINAPFPVIVYVSPRGARATSAGLFITMAADIAVMAPETHLGAAHPVSITGETPQPKKPSSKEDANNKNKKDQFAASPENQSVMEEKMVSDAAAYIRTLAKEKGRNADWAEKAVRESVSLTAEEALKNNVVDLIASNKNEILSQWGNKKIKKNNMEFSLPSELEYENFSLNPFQQFLQILAHPNVAYILMTIGIYGLIYELAAPGIGLGGVVGGICLVLAFFSLQILPINTAGLILIILGVIMIILELLNPTHGLLSFGGILAFATGSFFLIDIDQGTTYTRVSIEVIASMVITTAIFFLVVVKKTIAARKAPPVTGVEQLIGKIAEVRQTCSPQGQVFLNGELWQATADVSVNQGEKVIITAVDGNNLFVKKIDGGN